VRRGLIESLPIPIGYGVELSTLLDTAAQRGLDAVAQVHLGRRGHRHRSDRDMALAATELLAVAESRRRLGAERMEGEAPLTQFEAVDAQCDRPVTRTVTLGERPPIASLASYGARR